MNTKYYECLGTDLVYVFAVRMYAQSSKRGFWYVDVLGLCKFNTRKYKGRRCQIHKEKEFRVRFDSDVITMQRSRRTTKSTEATSEYLSL
jgi:hypothetical protein